MDYGEPGSKLDTRYPSIQDTVAQHYLTSTERQAAPSSNTHEEAPIKGPLCTDNGTDKWLMNDDSEDNGQSNEKGCCFGFTKREFGIVVMIGLVEFSVQTYLSLPGPFYTNRAQERGVTATVIGLIFGIVPLVSLILSPIFGTYIQHFGIKFLLVTSMMTGGSCCILFGFVDWVEDIIPYTILSFLVRGVEGVAAAAGYTAVFSQLAHTFPTRLATLSAFIEAVAGIGFTTGAPIGGALYGAGGYLLPFIVSGCVILLVGILLWVAAPSVPGETAHSKSHWPLLMRPGVILALLNLVCGISALGFHISRTGEFLVSKFMLSPLQVSVVYLCSSGSYFISTFFWGALAGWRPQSGPLMFSIGYMITGIFFMFLGPAPFIPIPSELWLFILCNCLIGAGLGAGLIAFQIVGMEAKEAYGHSLNTSGWVGGVLAGSFNLGEFLGPVLSGGMYDMVGFPRTCVAVGGLIFTLAFLQLLNHLVSNCRFSADDENIPLTSMMEKETPKYTE